MRPWFRGQAAAWDPKPSVLRIPYDEFNLTSTFRLKSLAYRVGIQTQRLDQWLFLAQHFGLPTRLLDWTESPVLACFFAIDQYLGTLRGTRLPGRDLCIWMLSPVELNRLSDIDAYPNTWVPGRALDNFRLAFHTPAQLAELQFDKMTPEAQWMNPTQFPLAVQASAVDLRVAVQRSCFTVHGWDEAGFEKQLSANELMQRGYFRKYVITRAQTERLLGEIEDLGISYSTAYPDLPGLAKELKRRFLQQ